jgi:hypothetical protein
MTVITGHIFLVCQAAHHVSLAIMHGARTPCGPIPQLAGNRRHWRWGDRGGCRRWWTSYIVVAISLRQQRWTRQSSECRLLDQEPFSECSSTGSTRHTARRPALEFRNYAVQHWKTTVSSQRKRMAQFLTTWFGVALESSFQDRACLVCTSRVMKHIPVLPFYAAAASYAAGASQFVRPIPDDATVLCASKHQ